MRIRLFALLLALAFFLPRSAEAVNAWGETAGCNQWSSIAGVSAGYIICFNFNENITDESEHMFSVSGYALAVFDGNLATVGASTATAELYFCSPTATDTTDCAQVCTSASCTFNSTPGTPSVQQEAVLLSAGTYRLKIKTVPGAGETGLFYVRGIGQ